MPTWDELLLEIQGKGTTFDIIRRRELQRVAELTGRNVILYYSGWLQKPMLDGGLAGINDNDKSGFMTTIHGLDRQKGLDLILHTPGGEAAATESLVDYLHQMFNKNIRAIVPQLAMSGGTMIACACKSIMMGKQSSLGPIDPQIAGVAAHGIVEEFDTAYLEIQRDQRKIPLWQPIIAKYTPTLIGESQKAIDWSNEMVEAWLSTVMFKDVPETERNGRVQKVMETLASHSLTKSHNRHLSAQGCIDIGLTIEWMEDNQDLQDAILSVHHAAGLTVTNTHAIKIIENHQGKAFIQTAKIDMVPAR